MSRRTGPRKERHHIHLTEGSWERLTELYASQGITPSSVIDKLVTSHLKRLDERIAQKMQTVRPEALEDIADEQ